VPWSYSRWVMNSTAASHQLPKRWRYCIPESISLSSPISPFELPPSFACPSSLALRFRAVRFNGAVWSVNNAARIFSRRTIFSSMLCTIAVRPMGLIIGGLTRCARDTI
jgi:hypothetical protein